MSHPLQFLLGERIGGIIHDAGIRRMPVDLFSVAARCGVRSIEIRDMVPRGGLECVQGGFKIYIRGEVEAEYTLPVAEPQGLDVRQRFTLAHELAHSLLYVQRGRTRPRPRAGVPKGRELEALCDENAARFLVPLEFLGRRLKDKSDLCYQDVVALAREFRASREGVLRQIARAGCPAIKRAVLLVEPCDSGEVEVRASWVGAELFPLFRPPAVFDRIGIAHPVFGDPIKRRGHGQWEKAICGRMLKVQRTAEAAPGRRYFIEVEVTD